MSISGVSLWGVVVAALVAFVFGFVWYGALGKAWQAAIGKTEAELKSGIPTKLAVTFLCELVMAFMLAGILFHVGGATIRAGVISGALLWVGFVATAMIVNYIYQGARRAQALIDGGHWLGVLLIQGIVLGLFGPP